MRTVPFLVLLLALPAVVGLPLAQAGEDVFPVAIHERILPNGMKVLVMPREGVPNVSCAIAYDVGSVNERPGQTGMAHYLEHMMFKGTEKMGVKDLQLDAELRAALDGVLAETVRLEDLPETAETRARLDALTARRADLIDRQKQNLEINHLFTIYREAGSTFTNAMTGPDWTTYIAALPPDKVELFFWVEADRLQNTIFRQFHAEKDVVREERRMYENRPGALFREGVQQAIFGAHPYAHPVLGYHEDLRRLTRQELRSFFRTYYAPDNATLMIGGDVDPERIFALAERYFGGIDAPETLRPRVPILRIPRTGEVRLEGHGSARTSVALHWRVPAAGTEEALGLELLALCLRDPEGLLAEDLVDERKLAHGVSADYDARKYGGVLSLSARLTPKGTHDAVERRMREAVAALRDAPLADEALAKLRRRYRAQILGAVRNEMSTGFLILRSEMAGSWRDIDRDLARVKDLPAGELRRIARAYLVPGNVVVTRYTNDPDAAKPSPAPAPFPAHLGRRPKASGSAAPARGALPTSWTELEYVERPFTLPTAEEVRVELEGGIPAFLVESPSAPMVMVSVAVLGGSAGDPEGKEGLTELAANVLGESGFEGMSPEALRERFEALVAGITVTSDLDTHRLTLSVFPGDLDEGLGLLRGMLEKPELDEAAFVREKAAMLARIDAQDTRMRGVTSRLYRQLLWGRVPETRRPTRESVEAISLDDLRTYLRGATGPGRMMIAASGSLPTAELGTRIAKALRDFHPDWEAPYVKRTTRNEPATQARGLHVRPMPASQGSVRIGLATVPATHADAPALRVLAAVLSQRIFNTIRSVHGLAYQAGTRFEPSWHNDSPLTILFQTKSRSVPFAIGLAMEELRKIREDGPTETELEDVRRGLDARFRTTYGRGIDAAQRFLELELNGASLDHDTRLRESFAAIDAAAVKTAAGRYLDPARLLILCVGDVEAMAPGDGRHPETLADFGEAERHEAPKAKAPTGPDAVVLQVLDAMRQGDLDTLKQHASDAMRERLETTPGIEQQLGMFRQMMQAATVGAPETQKAADGKAASTVPVETRMGEQTMKLVLRFELVEVEGVWKCDAFRVGP